MHPDKEAVHIYRATALSCCLLSLFKTFPVSAIECPQSCQCDNFIVDCSKCGFVTLPNLQWQQQHQTLAAHIFNLSFNALSNVELFTETSVTIKILDLSGNRISTIHPDVFMSNAFSVLTSLNLTENKISSVQFALPASLQVLKLGKNEISYFCLEKLKNLSNLRTLSLEGNRLKTLDSKCKSDGPNTSEKDSSGPCPFPYLPQISEVLIQNNRLSTLDQSTLSCFQNTRFMSLADNNLKSIPAKLFHSFKNLQYLDLSGNQLTRIPQGAFKKLPHLKFLSIARNHLKAVPSSLPMLEWLDLSYNAIKQVSESHKLDLYPQEVFLLGGNPLHCDCQLLWLKELFDTREYQLKFIEADRKKFIPTCASPKVVHGESWDVLDDKLFGCAVNDKNDEKDKLKKDVLRMIKDDINAIQIEDLAVRVRDFGSTFIRLEWETPKEMLSQGTQPRKVYVTHHPFGRMKEQVSAAVQLSLGTYRLRNLEPNTAYVVCISSIDPASKRRHATTSFDECVEVVTKDSEQFQLRDVYFRIGIVILGFVLLVIKCSCTSGCQRDVSSRRKLD